MIRCYFACLGLIIATISVSQTSSSVQITTLYNKGHEAIYKKSDGANGMRYMLQVKQLAQQQGDSLHYHLALYHLGVIEAEDRQYLDISQHHFEEAYRYFIKKPTHRQLCAEIVLNRVFNYTNLKQYDELLVEVEGLRKLIFDYPELDSAYYYFYLREKAHTLVLLKRLDEAYPLLIKETTLLNRQPSQQDRQCFNHYFWGLYYKYRSDCPKSIQYFKASVAIAYQIKDEGIIREGSRELSECCKALGRHQEAYQNLLIYADYNEKRRLKETKQIQLLSQEIDNQNKLIANQEKKALLAEKARVEQKASNTQIQVFLLMILLIIGGSAFILFYKYKQRRLDTLSLEVRLSKEQSIRAEKEQNLALTQSLLEGQEQERKRISAELHDSIGGLLSQLRYLLEGKNNQNHSILSTILDELFDEVRSIGTDLYSPHLQKFSLIQLVEGYCQKYKKNSVIEIQMEYSGHPFAKSELAKLHLFRIVQESVTNAIRHSKATQILVQLIYTEMTLSIIIEDNGVGLPPHDPPNGMGIDNMKNRATFIGADLSIDRINPQGTCVQVHWEKTT